MNSSRLLHAAARGARLQQYFLDIWLDSDELENIIKRPDLCRVHLEDSHLLYGPISTSLLGFAKEFPKSNDLQIELKFALNRYDLVWDYHNVDEDYCDLYFHRSLLLLILAEALADEGL